MGLTREVSRSIRSRHIKFTCYRILARLMRRLSWRSNIRRRRRTPYSRALNSSVVPNAPPNTNQCLTNRARATEYNNKSNPAGACLSNGVRGNFIFQKYTILHSPTNVLLVTQIRPANLHPCVCGCNREGVTHHGCLQSILAS